MKDTIYREDAIATIGVMYERCDTYDITDYRDLILESVKVLPSADRQQGEWKRRLVDNGFNADWICSECGYRVKTDFVSFNYCPNCGCRMRKENE